MLPYGVLLLICFKTETKSHLKPIASVSLQTSMSSKKRSGPKSLNIDTARVRSTREGNVLTRQFVHTGEGVPTLDGRRGVLTLDGRGGTYLGWGEGYPPWMVGGVPTLDGGEGYLPGMGGYLPWTGGGGTYRGQGGWGTYL